MSDPLKETPTSELDRDNILNKIDPLPPPRPAPRPPHPGTDETVIAPADDAEFGMSDPVPMSKRYRHKKRGSTYVVVGTAQVQAEEPIREDDTVMVYRGEKDGTLWARPLREFQDGRFEEIEGE